MFKRLAITVSVILAAVMSMAFQMPSAPAEIRTQKLVLVDKAGKVRATFDASTGPQDVTLLAMRMPNGEGRIHLSLTASGNAMISIDDAKGVRVLMGLNGTDSSVIVYNAKGEGVHSFSTR